MKRYDRRTSPFGWGYPAGAEHDPNAPYNQREPLDVCPLCGGQIQDENGLYFYNDVFCSPQCEEAFEPPYPPED